MDIVLNNDKDMHASMGLSWYLYGMSVTDTYTLSFYAKANNKQSINKKFKIYIGETEIDWITLNESYLMIGKNLL